VLRFAHIYCRAYLRAITLVACRSRRDHTDTDQLLLAGIWLNARPVALATDAANARVELGTLAILGLLATLAANFGIELGAMLAANRIAALFADFRVKVSTVLLTYSLTAAARFFGARDWSTFLASLLNGCHRKFSSQVMLRRVTETGWRMDRRSGSA
jgi:hypothetical protein